MGSVKTTLNPEIIDWQSDENHVLLNPRWSTAEMQSLFSVGEKISERRQLRGHVWLATSGSTAESVSHIKLVALAKSAFLTSANSVNQFLQTSDKDCWLQVLPRFHVGGLGVEVRAGLVGSRVVPDFERWNPRRIHQLIEHQQVTIASLVPTQVFDLILEGLRAPASLRAVIVGGGALTESLYEKARALGWPLLPSYGMTETCSQIATASPATLLFPQMPWPEKLSHAQWKLNPEGLLQVRGGSLLTCYGQRGADGLEIKDWDPKHEGWLTTEDFVQLQDSKIRFLGRRNDFIKIGGEGTAMGRLREIFERILHSYSNTVSQHLILIDAPSSRLGHEIHLVSSLANQAEVASQIRDIFNAEVLPFERIREIKYTQSIPRSDLGKVLWAQLKKDLYGH